MKKLWFLLLAVFLVMASCATTEVITKGEPVELQPIEKEVKILTIEKLLFCDEVVGYKDYIEVTEPVFRYGDAFYIYLEMNNIKVIDGNVSVIVTMSLTGPSGDLLFVEPAVNYEGVAVEPFMAQAFGIPHGVEAGMYKIEMMVFDRLASQEAYAFAYFAVDISREA